MRFGNSRDIDAYIEGRDIRADAETPSPRDRMNEYVMLRMRLTEGVDEREFASRFGASFEVTFGKRLAAYTEGGFVKKTDNRWAFTPRGMYVSNAILSEILEFDA